MTSREMDRKAIADLTMIGGVTARITRDTDLQRQYVGLAREHGASWRMIGVALGTSGQAAWQRYSEPLGMPAVTGQAPLPITLDETGESRSGRAPRPR